MQKQYIEPTIGNWYYSKLLPESFMVVDADNEDYIEVQYQDGELDKVDIDSWKMMAPISIEEPEDEIYPLDVDEDTSDVFDETGLSTTLKQQHLRDLDGSSDSWI